MIYVIKEMQCDEQNLLGVVGQIDLDFFVEN